MSDTTELVPRDDSPGAQIMQLRNENAAKIQELAARGMGIPDVMILITRLETLVDFAVGSAARMGYDFNVELRTAQLLESWEQQANTQRLLVADVDLSKLGPIA